MPVAVIYVFWFLVAISVLVTIHEYGHFIVARWCGVKVLRFSVGFGPRLITWSDKKGTEFALSAIPLGGYVKMLDEREGEVPEREQHLSFNKKSVGARIAIASAGPIANLLLAFVFYWAIFLQGTTVISPVIGEVAPGSIAEQAGLAKGQEILFVDGERTLSRRDVVMALLNRLGESGEISIVGSYKADGLKYETTLSIVDWLKATEEPDPLKGIGIQFYRPGLSDSVHSVVEGSPAALAELIPGDVFVSIGSTIINSGSEWVDIVSKSGGRALNLRVLRGPLELDIELTPELVMLEDGRTIGRAGITIAQQAYPEQMIQRQEYSIFGAASMSIKETYGAMGSVLMSFKKLLIQDISIKNLSGPIGIAKVAAGQAEYGFWAFVSFLAHLSVVLAVLNLLPIPVLDGGHILFGIVEWLKGSPLSERAQLMGVKAGMALLLSVMVVAFYNDILRSLN